MNSAERLDSLPWPHATINGEDVPTTSISPNWCESSTFDFTGT
jgi:hypothetical protein